MEKRELTAFTGGPSSVPSTHFKQSQLPGTPTAGGPYISDFLEPHSHVHILNTDKHIHTAGDKINL